MGRTLLPATLNQNKASGTGTGWFSHTAAWPWRDAPAPRDPDDATSPRAGPRGLLAVPGETFAPESRRGGSDLVHPAPRETPRRLLIGF